MRGFQVVLFVLAMSAMSVMGCNEFLDYTCEHTPVSKNLEMRSWGCQPLFIPVDRLAWDEDFNYVYDYNHDYDGDYLRERLEISFQVSYLRYGEMEVLNTVATYYPYKGSYGWEEIPFQATDQCDQESQWAYLAIWVDCR